MDKVKDALLVNKQAFNRTARSLKYLPVVFLTVVLTSYFVGLISYGLNSLFTGNVNSFVVGLIGYILEMMRYSVIVTVLYCVINGFKINIDTIKAGLTAYVSPLMSLFFIFYLVELLLGMFGLPQVFYILWFLIQSPMLETVYIGQETGMPGVESILNFLKENILTWVVLNVVFALILRNFEVVNRAFGLVGILPVNIPVLLVFALVVSLIYIYKGHLYTILYRSSFRKRKFQGYYDE